MARVTQRVGPNKRQMANSVGLRSETARFGSGQAVDVEFVLADQPVRLSMWLDADRRGATRAQQRADVPAKLHLFDEAREHGSHQTPPDGAEARGVDGGNEQFRGRGLGHERVPPSRASVPGTTTPGP